MATAYPAVLASGPGRLRLLIPRCSGDLLSGGRVTELPAAPPAARGHVAVVLVGKGRHRACLTVRAGWGPGAKEGRPWTQKESRARIYVGLPCPSAPHFLLGRGPPGIGDVPPGSAGTVSAFSGPALTHTPPGLGRHLKGRVDSGPGGASPTTSRLPPLLSPAGGCAPEGGRRTETAQTLAPSAPLGVSWHWGRICYPLPPAVPRTEEEAGGASGTRLPHRGASLAPPSQGWSPAGSCPGPSAHSHHSVQTWGWC